MRVWIGILSLVCAIGVQAAPKVAVPDMAFEQRVEEYIHTVSAQASTQGGAFNTSGSATYNEYEARNAYIEQGELRKFSGDIKGEILKSGMFELVQGTPYTTNAKEDVYDIISRIKKGDFNSADYVLFGTVSDIDFHRDVSHIANTNSHSAVLGLTLVGDYSLINTRTFEITAAFTSIGEGQDTKLFNGNDVRITPNRGHVVREVSKSMGIDVARQLREQLRGDVADRPEQVEQRNNLPRDEAPRLLR